MYLIAKRTGISVYRSIIKQNQWIVRTIFVSRQHRANSFESIPGPRSLPVIGTLYQYLPLIGNYKFDKLHINGIKKFGKFGPIIREEIIPGHNIVWIYDPEDIRKLFIAEREYPQRRSHLALEKYRLDKPNVYNTGGLLPTNGAEWKRIRMAFQKGINIPAGCLEFLADTDTIIEEWMNSRIAEVSQQRAADYMPELSRLFLELIAYVVLDIRLDSFSELELNSKSRTSKLINSALVTNSCILKTDNGLQLWRKFDTFMYRRLKKAQDYMESVAIDLISYKMSIFEEKEENEQPSLLERYLANPTVDFKDIIGVVCDFLLAGIDTTSYTASFVLYYLANHPEVQQTLYEESLRLLPKPNDPVTAPILKEARYARVVLKETLRLRPISVGVGRILTQDLELSGYHIPAGTTVVTQNQISCRLAQYFDNPDQFVPERWIKERPDYKKAHSFLVLPFGHGARACIAQRLAEQNLVVLILKLVRRYELTWNGDELDTRSLLINKPDGPILLGLRKR